MRLLILGGTGPAGIKLIEEALSAHHTLVVYARSPGKLPESISTDPAVTVVEGQLSDIDKLTGALEGVEAVLSVLGPGTGHPSGTPLAHAYGPILDAMKNQNVTRLIALGTPSIRDENDRFSLTFAALVLGISLFARNAYKDIIAIGETIRSRGEGLAWTIVRVPILNDRDTREVVAGYVGDGKTGAVLSRLGFAAFVIGELEKSEWTGKAPLISSA